jgi:hypothetical protein
VWIDDQLKTKSVSRKKKENKIVFKLFGTEKTRIHTGFSDFPFNQAAL